MYHIFDVFSLLYWCDAWCDDPLSFEEISKNSNTEAQQDEKESELQCKNCYSENHWEVCHSLRRLQTIWLAIFWIIPDILELLFLSIACALLLIAVTNIGLMMVSDARPIQSLSLTRIGWSGCKGWIGWVEGGVRRVRKSCGGWGRRGDQRRQGISRVIGRWRVERRGGGEGRTRYQGRWWSGKNFPEIMPLVHLPLPIDQRGGVAEWAANTSSQTGVYTSEWEIPLPERCNSFILFHLPFLLVKTVLDTDHSQVIVPPSSGLWARHPNRDSAEKIEKLADLRFFLQNNLTAAQLIRRQWLAFPAKNRFTKTDLAHDMI